MKKAKKTEIKDFIVVYVIESPSSDDFLTGQSEGKLLKDSLSLMGIKSIYLTIINEDALLKALKCIEKRYKEAIHIPVIHLSTHGNNFGIKLSNDKSLKWVQLEPYFSSLNKKLGHSLILCMSSCESFSAITMAFKDSKDIPYYILVGIRGTPYWCETLIGFTTFYHLWFFKNKNPKEALEGACVASGNSNFKMSYGVEEKKNWKIWKQALSKLDLSKLSTIEEWVQRNQP